MWFRLGLNYQPQTRTLLTTNVTCRIITRLTTHTLMQRRRNHSSPYRGSRQHLRLSAACWAAAIGSCGWAKGAMARPRGTPIPVSRGRPCKVLRTGCACSMPRLTRKRLPNNWTCTTDQSMDVVVSPLRRRDGQPHVLPLIGVTAGGPVQAMEVPCSRQRTDKN